MCNKSEKSERSGAQERKGITLDSFMKYIARIGRCSNCYRDSLLEGTGLTATQCPYLLRICHQPGISQDQLAGMLYVSKSNVTRQLERMEKAGFVTRTPLPTDRRVMQVFPTSKAEELMPRIGQILGDWNAIITAGFSDEERESLLGMLERLYANAEAAVTPPDCGCRKKEERP